MQTNFITKNKNVRIKSLTDNILSHHSMGAFISGTDANTLASEGNDTNCFVSLVVDTKGTYVAAVTRKVTQRVESTVKHYAHSYEFFGEGTVNESANPVEETKVTENTVIEYFMLDVDIEHVDNHLAYLDDRFDAIEAKKKTFYQPTNKIPDLPISNITNPKWGKDGSLVKRKVYEDDNFYDWIHSDRKKSAEAKESMLFSKEEMGEVDVSKWQPDPTVIHRMVIYLITCSLIVNDNIDLKQWIHSHMIKKYDKIFLNEMMFNEWKEFIIEFIISNYSCELDIPEELFDDYDTWQSKVAEAMLDEIGEYSENGYISAYVEQLMQYIIA